MHYHAEVWIENEQDAEAQVSQALAPFDENRKVVEVTEAGETYWDNPGGWWDWWEIGGRWKGKHAPDYCQENDPANQQICRQCHGSGDRPGWVFYELDAQGERVRKFKDDWAATCNGCNSCKGTGVETKWPTDWIAHNSDVLPVSQVQDDLTCFTLVVKGQVLNKEEWTPERGFEPGALGEKTVRQVLNEQGITDGYLVTVDYHC